MAKYQVPVEVKSKGEIEVEADSYEAAAEKADEKLYWMYQAGNPAESREINWLGSEIEVDGFEVNLDAPREDPDE